MYAVCTTGKRDVGALIQEYAGANRPHGCNHLLDEPPQGSVVELPLTNLDHVGASPRGRGEPIEQPQALIAARCATAARHYADCRR
jgi:hypothetical protein